MLGMPIMLSEKQMLEVQLVVNLHEIYGHTKSVIVMPQSKSPTTAWDCCIRQYWRIAHFRKNEPFSFDSDIGTESMGAPPLHQSHPCVRYLCGICYEKWHIRGHVGG